MTKGPEIRQAFEIEDLLRRENYSFVYEPRGSVSCYDTSRNADEPNLKFFFDKDFPFKCKDAYSYSTFLYKKALDPSEGIAFLGWVHPDTFEPQAGATFEEAMEGVPDKDPTDQEESL